MIRTIILDDEQPSVDKLEKLLNESGMAEIKGKFTESQAALDFLKSNIIDAAFIDIEMPDMDGIEFSNRLLDLQERVAVVFVTAYNQYAVEAFRLNALDFLMKPVTAERLNETLDRIVAEKEIRMDPFEVLIRCFGKFRIITGSGEVKFRTEKAEELLAFLIDRRGSFVNRNEIVDCLWEDFEGDRALIHFNTTLHYVKKALLQSGITAHVEHDRGSYRFEITGFDCDYDRFIRLVSQTESVSRGNVLQWEEAAQLYSDNYLAGQEYPWVERNRQMLKDHYIKLVLDLAAYYKAAGMIPQTIEWLKTGLLQEPLHREMNYLLIEALLAVRDRIAAERYFAIYCNELRKKLQQEPDETFQRMLGNG